MSEAVLVAERARRSAGDAQGTGRGPALRRWRLACRRDVPQPGGPSGGAHAKVIPPVGGDTGFDEHHRGVRGTEAPGMQALLRKLRAVQSYNGSGRPDHPVETAIHPVVRTHPDTGAKAGSTSPHVRDAIRGNDRGGELAAHRVPRPPHDAPGVHLPGTLASGPGRDPGQPLHPALSDRGFTGERRLLLRCTTMDEVARTGRSRLRAGAIDRPKDVAVLSEYGHHHREIGLLARRRNGAEAGRLGDALEHVQVRRAAARNRRGGEAGGS